MVHWAQTIGPHTARLFERILADKPHPEMGYRSCLGIIRLAGQYSVARMESAAERALVIRAGWGEGEHVADGRWLHAREISWRTGPRARLRRGRARTAAR